MNIVLFDGEGVDHLLPFTYTRPTSEIRVGIDTISDKWKDSLDGEVSFLTREYLSKKYSLTVAEQNVLVNGSVCPNQELVGAINELPEQALLLKDGLLLASKVNADQLQKAAAHPDSFELDGLAEYEYEGEFDRVEYPWDIFKLNDSQLRSDFERITKGRVSAQIDESNQVFGNDLFVEEGAQVQGAMLNTKTGPIYIGKNAEVMEGSVIRGPFALCDHAAVKLATKVYGATTVGPHSKIGGEVNNSVIFGYSNKGHDGFLGNSVLGEWCNLGADTNNSNLKNNYSEIDVWSHAEKKYVKTGLQFCGLLMGDHSKSGINTMFNTGTVVGVSANMYGGDFHKKFIPSFTWGGPSRKVEFSFPKACDVAHRMMERRSIPFDETEQEIFKAVYDLTADQR